MKLSEAIRLGAMLRKQAFTPMSAEGSCALRAACEAVGRQDSMLSGFVPVFGPICDLRVKCPECGTAHKYLTGCVGLCLNDTHHWSRERIADWVETIEAKLVETPTLVTEPAHAVAK